MEHDYWADSERKDAETGERLTDMTSSKEESDARIKNAFGKLVLLGNEYNTGTKSCREEDIIHKSNPTLNNSKKALADAK